MPDNGIVAELVEVLSTEHYGPAAAPADGERHDLDVLAMLARRSPHETKSGRDRLPAGHAVVRAWHFGQRNSERSVTVGERRVALDNRLEALDCKTRFPVDQVRHATAIDRCRLVAHRGGIVRAHDSQAAGRRW